MSMLRRPIQRMSRFRQAAAALLAFLGIDDAADRARQHFAESRKARIRKRRKTTKVWATVGHSVRPAITRDMLRRAHIFLDRYRRDERLKRASLRRTRSLNRSLGKMGIGPCHAV